MTDTGKSGSSFLHHAMASLPHIGMRKIKSILALFTAFWLWPYI